MRRHVRSALTGGCAYNITVSAGGSCSTHCVGSFPPPTLVSRYLILYCVFIGFCENCYFICLQMCVCVCVYMLTSISPSAASPFAYPSAIERNTTNPLGNYATRPMHTCSRLPPHRPLLCRRPRLLWKRVTSITEDIFAQCVHPSVCTCIHIPF